MTEKTKLYTSPVVIATAGFTVDNRELKTETLQQIADSYDPNKYEAIINLEHGFGNYGSVKSLELTDHPTLPNEKALLAILEPNRSLLNINKIYEEGTHFSIEYFPKFQKQDTAYLAGLALTNNPASIGTTKLEFSAKKQDGVVFTNWTETSQNIEILESENLIKKFSKLFTNLSQHKTEEEQTKFFANLFEKTLKTLNDSQQQTTQKITMSEQTQQELKTQQEELKSQQEEIEGTTRRIRNTHKKF